MGDKNVEIPEHSEIYPVPSQLINSHISSLADLKSSWLQSTSQDGSEQFWAEAAKSLDWIQPFTSVLRGSLLEGDVTWFADGKLNVCYNCLDRHVNAGKGDQVAVIWEGDDPSQVTKVTYSEAFRETCRYANAMKAIGLRKGDTVAIYMPNCPECAWAMLACARLGVLHSVVFAGFSAAALAARIQDASSKLLFTADSFLRGGKPVPLKKIADQTLETCPSIKNVFVLKRSNEGVNMVPGRDEWLGDVAASQRPYCPCETMDSEDPLYLLYTSGSTGKPKGMVHTQAGYILFASLTHKYSFEYRPGDIYACVADVGWVTGHSYIVYGPLCNGATTFMFEGVPTLPDPGRYWDMVQRHKITQIYTAPTAIRTLMKFGDEHVKKYDRSSLRILGTVGEPINPEAWRWYYRVVGESKCAVVDTYWQTESGGHLLTPFPGAVPTKPGSATFPTFGITPVVLDPQTGKAIEGNGVSGVLAISKPWPSIARTIWGDHQRYLSTYMKPYPGYYFTGDGCVRDKDGYYWISGRVDDVISISGHRLGTAEVESALVGHKSCAEAAVIAIPHEVKGQGIFAYVILKLGYSPDDPEILAGLRAAVRTAIGPFATPDRVCIVPALPKTRSGKIMRRVLRKIASGETDQLGDTSTLAEPQVVQQLMDAVTKK